MNRFRTKIGALRSTGRRNFPRFAFDANVELVDPITNTRILGKTTGISQHGCLAQLEIQPTVGSFFRLRIQKDDHAFETWAVAFYDPSKEGVGLRFIDTQLEQLKSLKRWLETLKDPPSGTV